MPCKDTTSVISVLLDPEERLVDYNFNKITCSKEIGAGTSYREFCIGKSVDELSLIEFSDLLNLTQPGNTEEQFLLYLEWDALRTSIAQYLGLDSAIDKGRYQLESIEYNEGSVEIRQVISPPSEMPKVIPCAVREKQKGQQS